MANQMDIFKGRRLAIATKHSKETVIGPRAASALGVLPFVPSGLNTDLLGTFTGEIERLSDPLTTARMKCEIGMEIADCDLAIASEGSFGMHPAIPFVPCDEEWVVLMDKKNAIEIIGKKLSTKTNYSGQLCRTAEEVMAFAEKVHFPSHALILRSDKDTNTDIFKGITEKDDLISAFKSMTSLYGHAFVETDMRACYNPMRMEVISQATDVMLEKAVTCCEKCHTPGFGITDAKAGLRCRQCNQPTQSIKAYLYSCKKCGHTKELPNPKAAFEEPMYCDFCNP